MGRYKQIYFWFSFIFLTAALCIPGLCGCKSPQENTITAETSVFCESVSIGGISVSSATHELLLQDVDLPELERILPSLPQLRFLTLEGQVPPAEDLLGLKEQFPGLMLICTIPLGDKTVSTDAVRLDLTDSAITVKELTEKLPMFFNLQELDLTGIPLSDEEKISLISQQQHIFVCCQLPLGGQYFSTDAESIDLSGSAVSLEEVEQMLPCFPHLKKLDLSFCGISDAQLDALNRKYPETSVIWTLNIGEVTLRTDADYFYPAEANYYPTNAEMEKLRYCTELIAVDIGHTRATDCEFLWYTPKVQYLILADTGITDISPVGNLKDLIYLELFNLKIQDYSPLLNCTKLQDLNIGTTYADPEPLSKMTWLHNLQWHRADQNPDTKEAVLKLPQQLPDTNVELYPKKKARNIGGPWRYLPNYYVFRDLIGAPYYNQDQIGDYWGEEDGQKIMACEGGKAFAADILAQIIKERTENNESIVGIKNIGSKKTEILYDTMRNARP